MNPFTVSVVLDDVDLSDEIIEAVFALIEDAVPSAVNGVVVVTAPVAAQDDEAAAFQLIAQLRAALPEATPVRLDQDLVSISDIAQRVGRTRESVRLLVEGKRGPGDFPPPVGTVGGGIRVWPWAVVLDWYRDALGEDLDERGVRPETAALVDACLAGENRRATTEQRWTLARTSTRLAPADVRPTSDPGDRALAS
jgi:hypothetical protein